MVEDELRGLRLTVDGWALVEGGIDGRRIEGKKQGKKKGAAIFCKHSGFFLVSICLNFWLRFGGILRMQICWVFLGTCFQGLIGF